MKEISVVNIGDCFGYLTVISECEKDKYSHKRYLCKCICGNETIVLKYQLTSGKTRSCGCLQKNIAKEIHTKHGLCYTSLYTVWKGIVQRCVNKSCDSYKNYGGRGITICDEWKNDFQTFYDWAISNGYKKGLEIERIDNNNGYFPQNCRFATHLEQANNKRNNIKISYLGRTLTVAQWARALNKDDKKIRQRIMKLKWSGEKALSE